MMEKGLKGDLDSVVRKALILLLQKTQQQLPLECVTVPLITEREFIHLLDTDTSSAFSSEPPKFVYKPGFNALLFLADKIAFYHPQRVEERKERRAAAFCSLVKRSEHAHKQLLNLALLRKLVRSFSTGVVLNQIWSLSTTSLCINVTACKAGALSLEYATNEDFSEAVQTTHSLQGCLPSKITISGLTESTTYFLRWYLTIHSGTESEEALQVFSALSVHTQSQSKELDFLMARTSVLRHLPSYLLQLQTVSTMPPHMAILGSLFEGHQELECSYADQLKYLNRVDRYNERLVMEAPFLHLAWEDSSPDSQFAIKEDERAIKRHAKELKRLKKPGGSFVPTSKADELPKLRLASLPNSLGAILQVKLCSSQLPTSNFA